MKNKKRNTERMNKAGRHQICADFFRAIRHLSFVLLTLLLPTLTFGADTANRWLFMFDTSSSMHSRSKGTEEMMQDLLTTGMHGQVHHGDTIGIWTFSDKLHAGEAPLQVWSPELAQVIARHTLQFLDHQRYSKSANLEVALTNMYGVVDSSDFITVVIFSDGDQPIKGTPFDDDINKQYKDNYRQAKKSGMPMITVLQANHGTFITNTVSFGSWPIDIPRVPAPPKPKHPVQPQAEPKPAPDVAPPIIFDGRKTQSAAPDNTTLPVANNATEPAAPVVTQPAVTAAPAETPAAAQPSVAAAPVETPAATQPAATPAAPSVVAETPAPVATPAPAAVPPPAEVAANNQPDSKPAVVPVTPAAANESEPPPAPPRETVSKPAAAPPPVETATSVPSPNLFSNRNLAIVSVAFAAIVCGLLLMAARNARKAHSSLITRSLDREQRQ